jgi:starch-binding outer membrane protein, SusD/RagB family
MIDHMNTIHEGPRSRRGRRVATLLLPVAVAVGLAGCDLDNLLDVGDPEVASPESVRDPSALPVVVAGAVRDFTYAYSGTGAIGGGGANDPLITLTGLFTDEMRHYGTFPTRQEVDRRAIPTTAPNNTTDNATLSDSYHNLHRARRAAELGEQLFEAADAGNSADRALLSNLAGFSYILFGEIYCEGVPYSSIGLDGAVTHAPPSTRAETFSRAMERFDRAMEIASAVDAADALNLARVGKARALLNMGQFAAAAAEVAAVPDDFVWLIEHSANSTSEANGVFMYSLNSGRYGVPDAPEGGVGLDWTQDERTPVVLNPRDPFDTSLPFYLGPAKYPDRNAPVVLADGREARLIRAEAALQAGDIPGFLGHLNAARAQDELDALTSADVPATDAGREDLLFAERGYTMWLTAHRLGDLRRLIRQYGRAQAAVFPTGTFFRDGLQYGTDVNFPIYVDENNNPEFTGCLNRDA